MLIVTTNTVHACNDKQQVGAIIEQLKELSVELGKPATLVADTGYFSESNVNLCGKQNVAPLIAVSREEHHPEPMARFTESPPLKEKRLRWTKCVINF